MSACEWCWTEAGRRWTDQMHSTGIQPGWSQTSEYHRVLDEQQALGKDAQCPLARESAGSPPR